MNEECENERLFKEVMSILEKDTHCYEDNKEAGYGEDDIELVDMELETRNYHRKYLGSNQ